MKLVTYSKDNRERPGVLKGSNLIFPIETFSSTIDLIRAGAGAMDTLQRDVASAGPESLIDPATISLSPPFAPASIRDCMVFEAHIVQATRAVVRRKLPPLAALDSFWERTFGRALIGAPKVWYDRPVYYTGNPNSVIGTNHEVRWPSFTSQLDFELEWGVLIGKAGRDIPCHRAADYIAGYTIFNDFSARDVQMEEMKGRLGPAKSKNFDTGNALGPWLVTPDEISDPYNLRMSARVNGESWCEGNTSTMHHTFEEIIAYISRDETLQPGDFIGSGTVGGGCGLELDRWLRPGDLVELEVEGLGVLRNTIGSPQ